ncbi:V-type proton ATPase subunit E [Dichanthelium oligosanthes]|uniref:V-type proton ATPase subunit E n=1 Tax=Dichanthelium oligosanthes TaxID=888268 RepID=A0A1E5V9A6_9POAL|nr:V-type proton ATPase subunit E [Dichanthelium oligosanthes]
MEDVDVRRQLKQMTDFIRQEAVEKAIEIEAAAAEEFQIEKLQLVEAGKKAIMQEYDREEKKAGIKKKIDYSMQLNASRIEVLQAQDDLVTNMMESARKELLYISRDHQTYKKLLRILIVQSLLRLKEPAVLLRCRKEDLELVDSVLESARDEYADKANVYPPEIVVDHHVFLPSAPSHYQAPGPSCSGGVVLASRDGKIVCENTLDARLQVAFRKKLPEIRQSLFGQVAA